MTAPAHARVYRRLRARVLALLASDYNGEAATDIVRAAGATRTELLEPWVVKFPTPPPAPRANWMFAHRVLAAAAAQSERLSVAEQAVLRDLANRCPPRLTERQRVVLAQVGARLGISR
jgi:hypothetical protein